MPEVSSVKPEAPSRGRSPFISGVPRPYFQYPFEPGAPGHEAWGRVDAVGGVWNYCLSLAEALADHSVQVALATMEPAPDDRQQQQVRTDREQA